MSDPLNPRIVIAHAMPLQDLREAWRLERWLQQPDGHCLHELLGEPGLNGGDALRPDDEARHQQKAVRNHLDAPRVAVLVGVPLLEPRVGSLGVLVHNMAEGLVLRGGDALSRQRVLLAGDHVVSVFE